MTEIWKWKVDYNSDTKKNGNMSKHARNQSCSYIAPNNRRSGPRPATVRQEHGFESYTHARIARNLSYI